jgi:single-strand DNA-binding protein
MHDTYLTVTGNVVDTPSLRKTKSEHWVANFRIASTPRKFDREKQEWVDGATLFVSVTAWRAIGQNARASLRRGDPVIVYGRYLQREYVKDEKLRAAYELEAISIGHDLARGTTVFAKATRASASSVDLDDDGIPVDAAREYIEFADDGLGELDPEVDPQTGEVRPFAPVG